MSSNEELHAEVSIEKSASTTKKRKAQRDPDISKKQARPKRRRKSPSPADFVTLSQDQHPNEPTSLSLDLNKSKIITEDDGKSKASRSAPKKSGRKVIKSYSPLVAASHASDPQGDNVSTKKAASDSDYDSEDEAPETVSATAGLLQSRRAAADVARAEEIKNATKKSKRRKHDARLKTQAKSAKERALADQSPTQNAPKLETMSKNTVASIHDESIAAKWSVGDPLPEFLPDEILAVVPEIPSAPVPSKLQSRKDPVKSKLKIFQTQSNRRKRFKRGSTVYQVLEDEGGKLPPKVAKRSMSLRESWLRGRPGPRGEEIIRRRKVGGGFVRK